MPRLPWLLLGLSIGPWLAPGLAVARVDAGKQAPPAAGAPAASPASEAPPATAPAAPSGEVAAPSGPPAEPAADPALAQAKWHFQQGVALYNDGDYDGALAEFLASHRARPAPGVLYNVGLCEKALHRYSEAIQTLQRYLDTEPKLSPERRQEVSTVVAELKALLGPVSFEIAPAEAQLRIDGRLIGTGPMVYGLAAGNHRVEISLEGHAPVRKELMVTAGEPLTVRARLQPIPRTGRLELSVLQRGATVRLDARELGAPPIEVELAPGGHQLEVTAPRYQAHHAELVIAAGQTRRVRVALERAAGRFYEKWYFWTPIIAGLAGGALGVGLGLYYGNQPIDGTLPPRASNVGN